MGPHLMDHLLGSVSLRAGEDVEVPRVTDDVEEIHIIRVGKEKERSEKRRKKEVKESAARGGCLLPMFLETPNHSSPIGD